MSLDVNRLLSELKIVSYDVDPNATTATDVGWVDMRDYSKFAAMFFRTIGTSNVTMTILANTASDGSGNEATVATKTFTEQPDAVGDYAFLEISADQIAQLAATNGYAYRYVSANITFATGTDEGVVVYTMGGPRVAEDDLTADHYST